MEQKLMEKDSSKRQEQIDNEMYLAREKALADANYYRHGWQYHILFKFVLLMHASLFSFLLLTAFGLVCAGS